jgi:hypothetical protein
MTDIEICQHDMLYPSLTPMDASRGAFGRSTGYPADLQRTTAMTIEILYLTTQLQRWLNERVARHLAAQAAKLNH